MNKKNYFLKQINYKLYVVIIEGKYVILIFFILLVEDTSPSFPYHTYYVDTEDPCFS